MSNIKIPFIKHLNVSDIHAENNNIESYFSNDLFATIDYSSMNGINLFTIAGDLFHMEYRTGDKVVGFMMKYVTMVCDVVIKQNNGYVVIVEGTLSHDGKTLQMFEHLTEMYGGRFLIARQMSVFKLIYNMTDGRPIEFKVLCSPHKYYLSEDEYKENCNTLLGQAKADILLLHGNIECKLTSDFGKDVGSGKRDLCLSPHTLLSFTKFYCVAGHIHEYYEFPGNRIFYSGELRARDFNSVNISSQGFCVFVIYEDGTWEHKHILNRFSKQFKSLDLTSDIINNRKNDINSKLINFKKQTNTKYRIDVDFAFLNGDEREMFLSVKDSFASDFMFNIKNHSVRLSPEDVKKLKAEKDFLLDDNVPIEDKLYRVISNDTSIRDDLKLSLLPDRISEIINLDTYKLMSNK